MEIKMAYPENNEKNRFELAENIISTWSLEDLREYAIREFESDYRAEPSFFEEEWDDFKDSFEWSAELRDSMKKDCPNPGCHCGSCETKENNPKLWQIKDATNGRR
jgi:hypothetical protein